MRRSGPLNSELALMCHSRLFAPNLRRDQARSHYAIHLSDASTQFETAIGDIADCSGSEG